MHLINTIIAEVITVALSCSFIFNVDFDHKCNVIFHELLMFAIDTASSILPGLLSAHFMQIFWPSIVPIKCLLGYTRASPEILQTHIQEKLVARKYHRHARFAEFSGCI